MVRMSKLTRRSPQFIIQTRHWSFLAILFSIASLFTLYILLSAKEQRVHERMIRASQISASATHQGVKPYIIYGTAWKKDETARLVSEAIHAGFRFIDTACQPKHYNEPGVGEGWTSAAHELGLSRSDFYIQTKFTSLGGQDPNNVPYDKSAPLEEQVRQSLGKSLSNLRTTYLDALVLHSPMPTHEKTMAVWRTFESFVEEGKVWKLGMSNCYDVTKFTRVFDQARIKPSVLQNRFYNKSGFDADLRQFCRTKGIMYQSFWTLTANRRALSTVEIETMAKAKGLTPQTLMFAFMMSLGHSPLSGTTNLGHMEEDMAVVKRIQDGEQIFADQDNLKNMAKFLGVSKL